MMTKRAEKMLRLMDRAVTEWHIPVIGREKGRVIKRLLARHGPTRGIEVGSLVGYSAILIAGNMPRGGRLTCIENNPYIAKFCQFNAEHAGLKGRVRVVVGDALRVPGPGFARPAAAGWGSVRSDLACRAGAAGRPPHQLLPHQNPPQAEA